jgi:hypothetical protein
MNMLIPQGVLFALVGKNSCNDPAPLMSSEVDDQRATVGFPCLTAGSHIQHGIWLGSITDITL